jgi:hypothetical protein
MTDDEIRLLIRDEIAAAGGQRALARQWGVSATWLSFIINGKAKPTGRVLERLGIRRRVIVERDPASC